MPVFLIAGLLNSVGSLSPKDGSTNCNPKSCQKVAPSSKRSEAFAPKSRTLQVKYLSSAKRTVENRPALQRWVIVVFRSLVREADGRSSEAYIFQSSASRTLSNRIA